MEPNQHNGIKKTVAAIGVMLILVLGIYFFVFHKTIAPPVLDQFGNPVEAQSVGSDLIGLMTKLQKVTLNDAIFSKPAFIQLTDFATMLPNEAAGEANPFGTFGGTTKSSASH